MFVRNENSSSGYASVFGESSNCSIREAYRTIRIATAELRASMLFIFQARQGTYRINPLSESTSPQSNLGRSRLQAVMRHASIAMTFDRYEHLFVDHDNDREAMKSAARRMRRANLRKGVRNAGGRSRSPPENHTLGNTGVYTCRLLVALFRRRSAHPCCAGRPIISSSHPSRVHSAGDGI